MSLKTALLFAERHPVSGIAKWKIQVPLACVFGIKPGIVEMQSMLLYNGNNMMLNKKEKRTETFKMAHFGSLR